MRFKTETKVGVFVLIAVGIFFYLSVHIGVFRFGRSNYVPYTVYFKDMSGLAKKADVKIAGVNVGWVEEVGLADGDYRAKASIMVLNRYKIHSDAYAVVQQDGLLGPKYLELIPGDPLMPKLPPGETLRKPSEPPVSINELMHQFKKIAVNVEEVTDSLKDSVGGAAGRGQLIAIVRNFSDASEKIASISDMLDRTLARNEDNVNGLLSDLREFSRELKGNVGPLAQDIRRLSAKLESDVLPSFQGSMEKVAHVFDRDFNRVANKLESTSEALEDAAVQTRDGFRNIASVAEKIDEGRGVIGKLINDDDAYKDVKQAIEGLKNYVSKIDRLGIVFDGHFESMYRKTEGFSFEDTKGYFGMRIHPREDIFYVLQLVTSQKGFIERRKVTRTFRDADGNEISRSGMPNWTQLGTFAAQAEEIQRDPDGWALSAQFGKVFKDIAFRLGLFEGFGGIGVDYDIPFHSDRLRWITSLEAFDFKGRNRIGDDRPHLKWLNRVFLMRNIYMSFGADDFISRNNANGFFGIGIRFGDDDIKYLLPKIDVSR